MGDEILIIHDTKLKSYPDWPKCNIPLFADLKRKQGRHRWYGDQDHSRWVYEDDINHVFFKVWNHTYIRKNNLLDAFSRGFYNGLIPAFRGVIKQNNDKTPNEIFESDALYLAAFEKICFEPVLCKSERYRDLPGAAQFIVG
jgi:hypothetical protein